MMRGPTLYLTCGWPGSGKTTLAKQLEKDARALRLTGDEWMHALYPGLSTSEAETGPWRQRVESVQWTIALRTLESGCNFVVDWGVWAKEKRDACRAGAGAVGARVALLLLDPPLEVLCDRLAQRNADRPFGVFEITEDDLLRWAERFERPTTEELSLYDLWKHEK